MNKIYRLWDNLANDWASGLCTLDELNKILEPMDLDAEDAGKRCWVVYELDDAGQWTESKDF